MYWYTYTGNVIMRSQIFTAFVPIILFVVMGSVRFIKRLLDRSCTSDKFKTKTKTILSYIQKHSGPEFLIHLKYVSVISSVFMSMIFGFGMPLLFPVTVLNLTIRYVCEVAMLYYSYKAPPSYSRNISDFVYSILLLTPIGFLAFGYWQASSLQLISNNYLTPIERASDMMLT